MKLKYRTIGAVMDYRRGDLATLSPLGLVAPGTSASWRCSS
jgi:hypothetical protein